MKALNLKSLALVASILVLSAGFTSCSDEPEMVTTNLRAENPGENTSSVENDSLCTVWWSVDEGVQSVTVNGKLYEGAGSIKAKVGQSISWEATIKPNYQFTSPGHDTFKVETGAEGGVIYIPISTQRGNL